MVNTILGVVLTSILVGAFTIPSFAVYDVVGIDSFASETSSMYSSMGYAITQFFANISTLVVALVAVALVVGGGGCIVGGDQSRQKFQRAFPWVLGGAFAMLSATTISKAFVESLNAGDGSSLWSALAQNITQFISNIAPLTTGLVAIALVVGGAGCIIGGDQSREKFKRAIPWIVGGSFIMLMANVLATSFVDTLQEGQGSSLWENIGNTITQFLSGIAPFTIALVAVALVGGGIGCIIGGEQSREKFKRAMPWIVGGSFLMVMATVISKAVVNSFSQDQSGTFWDNAAQNITRFISNMSPFITALVMLAIIIGGIGCIIGEEQSRGKFRRALPWIVLGALISLSAEMIARAVVSSYSYTDGQSIWQNFGDSITRLFGGFAPVTIALVTVALIIGSVGCIIGGEQSRQKFQTALPWIIGGAIIICGASMIASGITSAVG